MRRTTRLLLLALPVALASSACRGKRPAPAVPEPVAAPVVGDDAERTRREAEEAARRAEEERLRTQREAAERAKGALEASIHFAFDRSDLDAEARQLLAQKLPVLQANPDIRIRIAGHTDERGSDEYNLALSQRRAAAAKRWLTQREIAEDRIDLAAFGEERPTCSESAESCWALNRRDAFEITVGTVATASRP